MNKSKIFISYSHRGNGLAWKDRLIDALVVFERQYLLDLWHDEEMALGENWHERIKDSMRSSRLAILLLTDEMLKSPFVLQHEFPELKRRHESEGLIIAPILCEKCDWADHEWIASLQIKPRIQTDPTPLAALSKRDCDSALRKIATEIAEQISHATLTELPKPDAPLSPDHIYLDKFPLTRGPGLHEEKLIGREQELALLDLAFAQPQTAIATLVAWGGVGKTMLVQYWLRRLQMGEWYGVRRVYAWSFYSQGTTEDRQASEDIFLAHALAWFGVKCEATLWSGEKGRLLAQAMAREPTLLVLDGIEPLQYPPGPMGGQLRAPGVQSLLKQLARKAGDAAHTCLCLVTTRELLADLSDFERRPDAALGSVLRIDLGNLIEEAGAALLHHAGAKRAAAAEIRNDDTELFAASREVAGHALTLNLLGRFLARAHGGDIRCRDLVKFEEADRKEQGGTTFKMLAAFEGWFANEGDIEARALSILRMLGLFDRPADSGCLSLLRKPPVIEGLTEPLFVLKRDPGTGEISEQALSDKGWNDAVHFLADFGLILVQSDPHNKVLLLDCHPLIREYFESKIYKKAPVGYRIANERLCKYLYEIAPKTKKPSLLELQPLYDATVHSCKSTDYKTALAIWHYGIRGSEGDYGIIKLGAYETELSVLSHFFSRPWDQVFNTAPWKSTIFGCVGFRLMVIGRLKDAKQCMLRSVEIRMEQGDWFEAAREAGNLSEACLLEGEIDNATSYALKSVDFAKITGQKYWIAAKTTCLADSLNKKGNQIDAFKYFAQAEQLYQIMHKGPMPGVYGYVYCDLLLQGAEYTAWSIFLGTHSSSVILRFQKCCDSIERRAKLTIKWAKRQSLGEIYLALDELTIGKVNLYRSLFLKMIMRKSNSSQRKSRRYFDKAVKDIYHSATQQHLPSVLVGRAWLSFVNGEISKAKADLDEAWDIASRGPMRLHMADIHLYRARLFFREERYPWESPQADLEAAEKLINECGYHRRDEELADAKRAILVF